MSTIYSTVDIASNIAEEMRSPGYLHLPAATVHDLTETALSDWTDIREHWDDLVVDQYMADGGTYRRRRYRELALNVATGELSIHPPRPYNQPRIINHLNGGIERHFAPCNPEFLTNPLVTRLIRTLGEAFTQATGTTSWNVRLHQNRISATPEQVGQPAPEGMHRDGVTFIMTLLIGRTLIEGGESSIHTPDGTALYRATLHEPGELLIADDHKTLHSVTPITPLDTAGHRDVLVISFTDPADD